MKYAPSLPISPPSLRNTMQTVIRPESMPSKMPLAQFLAHNPFPHPLTEGFFYREKMRAIHQIAPDRPLQNILEVGGGQSGLTALLYPQAQITNIDFEPQYAQAPCNRQERVQFVCGDATNLPFGDASFDAITMFDLLEHVPEDQQAIAEALRVLKPDGVLMISTPNENWRFPYYDFMKPICPSEASIMAEWGHVRRGYSLEQLKALIPLLCQEHATFINPVSILCHDVAFSALSHRQRRILCTALSPVTWLGYHLHFPHGIGTETASIWRRA
jgi:SAM-dependent methyltransferase